ncbi:MAG TPA: sensor histidine kinase [Mycobacteriales bacterium]|nr:sensor histidine kinase [Mycobacteriales bacterium]
MESSRGGRGGRDKLGDGSEIGPGQVRAVGMVAQFAAAGLIVLLALAALIAFAARQAGIEQAVESAQQVTEVTANDVVEPRLDGRIAQRDPVALTQFDQAMHRYVLHGSLVRVKLWDASGQIIYSDEPRLIGSHFALDTAESGVLARQRAASEVSDLARPENRFESQYRKLLEVYVGVRGTDGRALLFEAYFRYDAVNRAGLAAWQKFAPPSLGALLGLEVVQIPFAWSLARRLQRQQRERERLLRHAVDSSDLERRHIAGALHDGVVQDLTGVTYALDAARLGKPDEERRIEVIRESASRLRGSVSALRSLLVDIYPPSLADEGLPLALTELTGGLEDTGIHVELHVADTERLPLPSAALLFRCAQEVLRNIAAHSNAESVEITAWIRDGTATLMIDDDGRGFDEAELGERLGGGHFGLRSLGDLLADAGGRLEVRSAPGQGTRVEAEIPVN